MLSLLPTNQPLLPPCARDPSGAVWAITSGATLGTGSVVAAEAQVPVAAEEASVVEEGSVGVDRLPGARSVPTGTRVVPSLVEVPSQDRLPRLLPSVPSRHILVLLPKARLPFRRRRRVPSATTILDTSPLMTAQRDPRPRPFPRSAAITIEVLRSPWAIAPPDHLRLTVVPLEDLHPSDRIMCMVGPTTGTLTIIPST